MYYGYMEIGAGRALKRRDRVLAVAILTLVVGVSLTEKVKSEQTLKGRVSWIFGEKVF